MEIYTIMMGFVLIHELGHMLTGICLKLKPKELMLMPFGISIIFEGYGYNKLLETKKILVALGGPIINLTIALITYFLHIDLEVKNLIPLYPLDGGRILKGLLRKKLSIKKTDSIINRISNIIIIMLTVVSSIAILYLKNIAILFLMIYLWIIVIKENKRYNIKKTMYEILQTNDKNGKYIDI